MGNSFLTSHSLIIILAQLLNKRTHSFRIKTVRKIWFTLLHLHLNMFLIIASWFSKNSINCLLWWVVLTRIRMEVETWVFSLWSDQTDCRKNCVVALLSVSGYVQKQVKRINFVRLLNAYDRLKISS